MARESRQSRIDRQSAETERRIIENDLLDERDRLYNENVALEAENERLRGLVERAWHAGYDAASYRGGLADHDWRHSAVREELGGGDGGK